MEESAAAATLLARSVVIVGFLSRLSRETVSRGETSWEHYDREPSDHCRADGRSAWSAPSDFLVGHVAADGPGYVGMEVYNRSPRNFFPLNLAFSFDFELA